ncbi:hypothetical protein BD414DRAFT_471755 [Trametes punicea]|nr:hypothetical protein BD414DRAFT_471755 [Trametes punicea]
MATESAKLSLAVMHKHPFLDLFRYIKHLNVDIEAGAARMETAITAIFADTRVASDLRSSHPDDFKIDFYEILEPLRPRFSLKKVKVRKAHQTKHLYESRVHTRFLEEECKALRDNDMLRAVKKPDQLLVILCALPGSRPMRCGDVWTRVNRYREAIASAAQKRTHPSLEARHERLCLSQVRSRIDAVYNGPFWTFKRVMAESENTRFTPEELRHAVSFITECNQRFDRKADRVTAMQGLAEAVHPEILTPRTLVSPGGQFAPDGVVYAGEATMDGRRPIVCMTEIITQSDGLSYDITFKAEQDYLAYCCSKEAGIFRQVSSCACLLVSISGSNITVNGALLTDRIISHWLCFFSCSMGFLAAGDEGPIRRVAALFRALRAALEELDAYYAKIAHEYQAKALAEPLALASSPAPAAGPAQQSAYIGPHFRTFSMDGKEVKLTYTGRSREVPSVAAYTAYAEVSEVNGGGAKEEVVVLFMMTCAPDVHRLLANPAVVPGAPRLWLCEWVESTASYVIVMDRIDDEEAKGAILTLRDFARLHQKAKDLFKLDMLFGERRDPYVLTRKENGLLLVDFDCSKEARRLRYFCTPEATSV